MKAKNMTTLHVRKSIGRALSRRCGFVLVPFALASNITGSFNMAIGTDALRDSTANYNLAIGFRVGFVNTTGNHLTGIGAGALFSNTTGSNNTAIGSDA